MIARRMAHTAWHLMNFMLCHITGFCLRLAFEKELADLKDLVDPDSLCGVTGQGNVGSMDVELELIEILDDPVIKILRNSMARIVQCRDVMAMINNLDIDKALYDTCAVDLARSLCAYESYEPDAKYNYKQLVSDAFLVYVDFYVVTYMCSCMFSRETLEVFGDDIQDEFMDDMTGILGGDIVTGNQRADLLLDLIADLREHDIEILNYG